MEAVKQFFKQAVGVVSRVPDLVTTDGQTSYPRARREMMSSNGLHPKNKYLNNRLEQDHQGIKQRSYPIHDLGSFASASCFCCAFEEVRQFFGLRTNIKHPLSLADHRRLFCQRRDAWQATALMASPRATW